MDGKPVTGSQSEKAFHLMEQMFALEKEWAGYSAEERKNRRNEKLKPILDAYWEHLNSFEAEKDTALYKAQRYSLNQRAYLGAVLLDGRIELTNNLAERTVKPFVMARKNFLFCDTSKGADASTLCFSMIETAKKNGLDPFGYLLYLLQELPKLGEDPDVKSSCGTICHGPQISRITVKPNNFMPVPFLTPAFHFLYGGLLSGYCLPPSELTLVSTEMFYSSMSSISQCKT